MYSPYPRQMYMDSDIGGGGTTAAFRPPPRALITYEVVEAQHDDLMPISSASQLHYLQDSPSIPDIDLNSTESIAEAQHVSPRLRRIAFRNPTRKLSARQQILDEDEMIKIPSPEKLNNMVHGVGLNVYSTAVAPQPHTPQTPQPPYTPNGSRFTQPTASPLYSNDMRSPPLMSPTQAPMAPQAAIPRPMSNGDMVTQPIRLVPAPQQPIMPSQFFTYEPNFMINIHPDICLAGCVLHMFDMDRIFTDKLDLPSIVLAIRMHGGDIEFGAKAYAERSSAITHVIVDSIRTQHAHLALKDRKRLVTMQWLVDVLLKKQMDVPWRHAHLPSVFIDGCRPLLGKLVSFSGYDESERAAMKFMVEAMGARFTPYLSRHNSLLIAKAAGVEKVEKAREWDIQVVNYQWLADSYAGLRVDSENQRYQVGQPCEGVSPGPYVLETMNDQFKQLLLAWKMPVIVSPEQWRRSFDAKQAVENDEGVFPNKKLRMQSAPPSEAEIAAKAQDYKKFGDTYPSYVVAFSGIDDENKHVLTQKLRYLGGRAVEEVSECTHLVTTNGRRTERLLEAICLGKNIVNPYWIVHGYECRQWMGKAKTTSFFDPKVEVFFTSFQVGYTRLLPA
ncbi:unnamed protein product [Haemonchus placei]|uniref:PAX-interacting protein 1 n=1 Tax=Haemonchus placei TaxID=6290 RepID=A0A0N4X3L4_HAEPC|nr:unnamed protein product [Haemonchus placei]